MRAEFSLGDKGVELVHIIIDHTSTIVRPATDEDLHRFKYEYAAWKAGPAPEVAPAPVAAEPASEPVEPSESGDGDGLSGFKPWKRSRSK